MKKALMYATVASMIDLFNMDNIRILQDLGYEVHVAANFKEGNVTSDKRIEEFKDELHSLGVKYYHIPIPRSISNLKVLKKSYDMTISLKNSNQYELVHCHTPVGSAICRMAFRKSHAEVIYTAHGFHFFKGSPLKNWIIYYPVEKLLSKYTDILITINKEDYVQSKEFHAKYTYYIPGVGIDLEKFSKSIVDKNNSLKKELQLKSEDFIIFSTGELNHNKNHEVIIRAIAELKKSSIHYVIAGQGPLEDDLIKLAKKLNVFKQVHLLGYRDNISELLNGADIFAFPSHREGLSVSLMEAMATGLPAVVSRIRGNLDLISDFEGGYLVEPDDIDGFATRINTLFHDKDKLIKFGSYNRSKIQDFSNLVINKKMLNIYKYKKGEL